MRATIANVVIRKRALPAAAVAVAVALTGLIAGCGGSGSLGDPNGVAVTVEKVKITNARVERLAKFLGTAQDPTTGSATKLPKSDSDAYWALRADAAQQLRDQAVYGILASACGKACAVSDKDVETQISAIVTSSQFSGSTTKFDATLKERGITRDDLKDLLRSGLQQQKLVAHEQKTVTFTAAQAQAYYDKNLKSTYTTAASKHLSHILLKTKADALALRSRLTAANFADTAKSVSLDVEAKTTGGDLGLVNSPGLIPEIAAAATTLKPGVVSQPVETQFGWHLLIVVNVAAKVTPFADVKDKIIQEQLQAAKDAKATKWQDTVVKKLQDAAVFTNSRLAPKKAATTTAATTPSTSTTATTSSTNK